MRFTLIVFAFWNCWGQQDSAPLRFEVASVRLHTAASPTTGRSGIEEDKGLIRIENLSLKSIIEAAYGVKDYQFAGPAWLSDICFDVVAKPPGEYKHDLLQPLLRSLLFDRFKLAVHSDSKEMAGFALIAAKGGHKLHEATKPRGFFTVRPGMIAGSRVSMPQLAGALARMLGRPVADQTGLGAAYEIKVEWTPDQTGPSAQEEREVTTEPLPSLFTAIADQLGLRLQAQRVRVQVVVVDHVAKVPTEN